MPTTFYVSDTSGDDGNSGASKAEAKKTITAARNVASDGDTIEIIDEATYNEFDINLRENFTIIHTASELGRPTINGGGSGVGGTRRIFFSNGTAGNGITLSGLHLTNANFLIFNSGGTLEGLTIQDCFVNDIQNISKFTMSGSSGGGKINFNQSSFFFLGSNAFVGSVNVNGYAEITNCFFSKSNAAPHDFYKQAILRSPNSSPNVTASFSTFIYRNGASSEPVIQDWAKVINCIVTSSNAAGQDGIQASDHTFNLVHMPGDSFINTVGNAESAGTGDIEVAPTFVDGTVIGNSDSIVANFALVEGSRGVDEGTTFNSINVDIIDTVRPQNGSFDIGAFEFTSGGGGGGGGGSTNFTTSDGAETFNLKFGSNSFVIHGTANKLATRRFNSDKDNRQAPFSVTVPGPATIRRRTTPYKSET